jgi:hypothetical protein
MHTTTVGAKTRADNSRVRPGLDGIRMARTMTVTVSASSTWRIWPSSSTVMRERNPPATTKLTASSAPRPHKEGLTRLARSQSRAMVRLAQRCPSATGPRTTAANGAPPTQVRLARRKR